MGSSTKSTEKDALEDIHEERVVTELAAKHPYRITRWKRQAIETLA